ncbi:MAG: hypothetical protein ABW067_09840 [Rhizobacter sp.]
MAGRSGSPATTTFSPFYCESATITDVNRRTWTCSIETTYSAKALNDVPWGAPYTHFTAGEGIHYMPEVGAPCFVAFPVDKSPPFILCFVALPSTQQAKTDDPLRSGTDPKGSSSDVSYQGNRPELNPGDIAITGRDGNFIYLRRGGVLQLGATPIAQRIVVPVKNFVHDFAENYELVTPGGDWTWLVDRAELDSSGKQACSWTMHLQEFATDKLATVRLRYLPLAEAGADKAAWEIDIAQNGIDRQTGSVTSVAYSMKVLTDGTKTEMVGVDQTIKIVGNSSLEVGGDQVTKVKGDETLDATNITYTAKAEAALVGKAVKLGDTGANEPGTLGNQLLKWLTNAIIQTPTGPGKVSPISLNLFNQVLSKKVFLK